MNELFKDDIDKLKAYMAVMGLNQTKLWENVYDKFKLQRSAEGNSILFK